MADHGLLFRFGSEIDAALSERIVALAEHLGQRFPPGVQDIIPSYTTLLLIFDPSSADPKALISMVRREWSGLADDTGRSHQRPEVVIPVAYGGDGGPDLLDVAQATGLNPGEVIARHTGATYQVGAIGFAPGFAFLIGLPPELATPRRSTPRTRVPSGSVGIGGAQTGIYSLPTPGGWSLIGRTGLTMFDPNREPPSLLRAGDRIRFQAIDTPTTRRSWPVSARPASRFRGRIALEIVAPGLQDTVQDLGRVGYGPMGVNPGGAADRTALVAGNRLLGNPAGAAALEMTLVGPHIRFCGPGRFVLTGADFRATFNDLPLPVGAVRVVKPGDDLRFSSTPPACGARAYLCLQGGIDVPLRLGSWSTDLTAGFGGLKGRPLRAGDRLATGSLRGEESQESGALMSLRSAWRVMPGPQRNRFSDDTWRQFLASRFTVSPSSNRMGIRLDGPPLVPEGSADIISEGMVTGAVQVTGSGQPIVALPGRATIGGYPKIAVVMASDLDALGQLKPGDQVTFVGVE
jgi:KipI family sensor histidine kinase inhibitor